MLGGAQPASQVGVPDVLFQSRYDGRDQAMVQANFPKREPFSAQEELVEMHKVVTHLRQRVETLDLDAVRTKADLRRARAANHELEERNRQLLREAEAEAMARIQSEESRQQETLEMQSMVQKLSERMESLDAEASKTKAELRRLRAQNQDLLENARLTEAGVASSGAELRAKDDLCRDLQRRLERSQAELREKLAIIEDLKTDVEEAEGRQLRHADGIIGDYKERLCQSQARIEELTAQVQELGAHKSTGEAAFQAVSKEVQLWKVKSEELQKEVALSQAKATRLEEEISALQAAASFAKSCPKQLGVDEEGRVEAVAPPLSSGPDAAAGEQNKSFFGVSRGGRQDGGLLAKVVQGPDGRKLVEGIQPHELGVSVSTSRNVIIFPDGSMQLAGVVGKDGELTAPMHAVLLADGTVTIPDAERSSGKGARGSGIRVVRASDGSLLVQGAVPPSCAALSRTAPEGAADEVRHVKVMPDGSVEVEGVSEESFAAIEEGYGGSIRSDGSFTSPVHALLLSDGTLKLAGDTADISVPDDGDSLSDAAPEAAPGATTTRRTRIVRAADGSLVVQGASGNGLLPPPRHVTVMPDGRILVEGMSDLELEKLTAGHAGAIRLDGTVAAPLHGLLRADGTLCVAGDVQNIPVSVRAVDVDVAPGPVVRRADVRIAPDDSLVVQGVRLGELPPRASDDFGGDRAVVVFPDGTVKLAGPDVDAACLADGSAGSLNRDGTLDRPVRCVLQQNGVVKIAGTDVGVPLVLERDADGKLQGDDEEVYSVLRVVGADDSEDDSRGEGRRKSVRSGGSAEAIFGLLDANKDGAITRDEWRGAMSNVGAAGSDMRAVLGACLTGQAPPTLAAGPCPKCRLTFEEALAACNAARTLDSQRPPLSEAEAKVSGKWNPNGTFEIFKAREGSIWFVGIDEDLDEIKGELKLDEEGWWSGMLKDIDGDDIGRFRLRRRCQEEEPFEEREGVVEFCLGSVDDDEWADPVAAYMDMKFNKRRPSTTVLVETGAKLGVDS